MYLPTYRPVGGTALLYIQRPLSLSLAYSLTYLLLLVHTTRLKPFSAFLLLRSSIHSSITSRTMCQKLIDCWVSKQASKQNSSRKFRYRYRYRYSRVCTKTPRKKRKFQKEKNESKVSNVQVLINSCRGSLHAMSKFPALQFRLLFFSFFRSCAFFCSVGMHACEEKKVSEKGKN